MKSSDPTLRTDSETSARRRNGIRSMTYIALCTALLAVCSWISIPIPGGVPFTLQTFGVFAVLFVLGGRRGTVSVLLYLLMGAIGVPVFSGFSGGIGRILSSTGGYILGFLVLSLTVWAAEALFGRKTVPLLIAMVIGLALCYAFGTAWYMIVYARQTGPIGLSAALMGCVVPFIVPDLVKLFLAFGIGKRVKPLLKLPD